MEFANWWWLAGIPLAPLPFIFFRPRGTVGISHKQLLTGVGNLAMLEHLPSAMLAASLALTFCALARPQQMETHGAKTIYSRSIVIATDVSHSMTDPFAGRIDDLLPKPEEIPEQLKWQGEYARAASPGDLTSAHRKLRKIDAAQAAIMRFVLNRFKQSYGDRIGIILFDMQARLSWPLTTDLKQVFRNGAFLSREAIDGGTNFGELPGGPIDLAIQHFDETDNCASKVIVLMTDGVADFSPKTQDRLYKLVSARHIHMYLVGIGPELRNEDLPIAQWTRDRCHGMILHAENGSQFARCFDEIDAMERTPVLVPASYERRELFVPLALAALAFLALALVLRAVLSRAN